MGQVVQNKVTLTLGENIIFHVDNCINTIINDYLIIYLLIHRYFYEFCVGNACLVLII